MEFHIIRNGKQEGPFTVEELSQQGINAESEVWAPGMADWQQAGDVAELTAVLQKAEYDAARAAALAAENQPTTGQPYDPPTGANQAPPRVPPIRTTAQEPKKRSGCTGWLVAALILAILFATMVFTCPDRQDHEEAIQEVTKEWMGDKIEDNIGNIAGNGIVGKIINKMIKDITGLGTDKAISNFLDVKNYVICSVGRIHIGDSEEKTVSLGVFGHVFTFGKEDLEKAWAQALDNYESRHEDPVQAAPVPQEEENDDEASSHDVLPDTVMGVAVPDEMDSLAAQVANDALNAAKKWAKRKIDEIGN